jgi:hypothetical protein
MKWPNLYFRKNYEETFCYARQYSQVPLKKYVLLKLILSPGKFLGRQAMLGRRRDAHAGLAPEKRARFAREISQTHHRTSGERRPQHTQHTSEMHTATIWLTGGG